MTGRIIRNWTIPIVVCKISMKLKYIRYHFEKMDQKGPYKVDNFEELRIKDGIEPVNWLFLRALWKKEKNIVVQ